MKIFVFILLISIVELVKSSCSGCAELYDLSFDKIVKKFQAVLVKFDTQFPYGEVHETFSAFADEVNNKTKSGAEHEDFLTGVVGWKDYGDANNQIICERYGLTKRKDFPAILLFVDGDLVNPIDFKFAKDGKLTTTRLYGFVKANSKIALMVPGCVKELDERADEFIKEPTKRKDILEASKAFIDKLEDEEKKKVLKTYLHLMKGIIEKGEEFIPKQRERMTNLLKDKLSEAKIEEINQKLNIVASFRVATGKETGKQEL